MRKKSNTRSYFFEISQPSRICAVASPVFYFTFILYLFGEGVAPTKNAGSTLGTVKEKKSFPPSRRRGRSTVVFAWAILSTRSRRRAVRRSPVAGAAPPHFRPVREKAAPSVEGAGKRRSIKKAERRRLACDGGKAFPPHAAVGVLPWFLLGQFYLPAHAGGLSAAPRSPVLLRRIFARREQKAAPSVEGAGKRCSIKKAERRLSRKGKKVFPRSRRRGRSVVVFAWAILFTRSRRRAVRRSPVAGAAPPHFCPVRTKSGSLR